MEPVPSDADCLARSLSEPRAFEPIFHRHFDAVHRYLSRRVGHDLADELAAQSFAIAFERRGSCRTSDTALPWLYGIATNLLRRRRRAEVRLLRALARSGVDVPVADNVAVGDPALARALAAMRPQERDALLLYALADLTYAEIAFALDIPIGTVRTRLHRARMTARRVLGTEPATFPLETSGVDVHG